MRSIRKGPEPPSLTRHRQTPHSDYDNYPEKGALREALVKEQQGLCCYCMSRISAGATNMKIEHWRCQDLFSTEQLSYQNLLGACRGGHGRPEDQQHCDTKKGNKGLTWNPANPDHHIEDRVYYEASGTIASSDEHFNTQLSEVLNLNLGWLCNNRKAVWDGTIEWLKHENARLHGPIPMESLERRRDREFNASPYPRPYFFVAVWILNLRLKRRSS